MQLRKYMSSNSLFDLIIKRRLYFHPLYLFEDATEGSPLSSDVNALREFSSAINLGYSLESLLSIGRVVSSVCCWHRAEHESVAMWKIYAGTGQGCCIIADEKLLVSTLSKEQGVKHFPVEYVDKDSHVSISTPIPHLEHSARFKSREYDFEREYRFLHIESKAIKTKTRKENDGSMITEPDLVQSTILKGRYVNFDWGVIGLRVLVSPYLAQHEQETISNVVEILSQGSLKVERSTIKVRS
jgi:hypothetical protein